jgi:hypothetical protein
MTLVREYQPTFVLGDGETKEFPYLFEEVSENFIKVIVKHSDDSTYTPVFSVDLDAHKVVFGESETAPLNTDVVCIYRNTPDLQDTPFRTLQGYDAKALENILSKIVAMIQEMKSNGFSTQILQGTPWQLDLLHPADDGASVVIDYNARILKKGLYFQIVNGNLQVSADGNSFITMPKSADITEFRQLETVLEDLTVVRKLQYKVNGVWYDAEANAQATADQALSLAQTVQGDLSSHKLNHNNPHETTLSNLTDVDFTNLQANQFLKFNGIKWVNVYSSAVASWGAILGTITDQTDLMAEFAKYVRTDGSSTMTNPLMMRATDDFKCAIAPSWDGVGFFKLNDDDSVTLMASMEETDGLTPATNNKYNIGKSAYRWKDLYLSGTAFVATINNGYDIAVPVTNSADTLALKSQVDDAANSGSQLYTTGVWYAKMYAATVVPTGAEYDGRNYADFSQVDNDNNPIIVIYTGASGVWTETARITPPATYNGYITVTSKIWDIAEQSGQQGGVVLWSYNQKTFTPYPKIISFENAALTGNSTTQMPLNPTGDTIVNVDYLATHNGTGRNVGDIFFTSRTDNELNGAVACNGGTYDGADFTGSQNPVALMDAGKLPYVSLAQYATLLSTQGSVGVFGWDGAGTTTFRVPSLNDVFLETGTAAEVGDYISAGVPSASVTNIIGVHKAVNATGGASASNTGYAAYTGGGDAHTWVDKYTLSLNQGVYGNSATVQPETIRYRAMIQLAISATDEAVMTCTNVTAQVAANTSAINGADYVVETQMPTAENGWTWYRKYKSGWVEQGGFLENDSTDGVISFNLPIEMANTLYYRNFCPNMSTNTNTASNLGAARAAGCYDHDTTTTIYFQKQGSQKYGFWEVKGIAAS